MMEKQSKTFDGLMSTMADTIKMEVTKIGTMLIEKLDLRGLLTKAIPIAEKVGATISSSIGMALDWIVPKIKYVAGVMGSAITTAVPYFVSAGKVITSIFNPCVDALPMFVVVLLGNFFSSIS